ncbi:hypothetical protein HII36_23700 [Nonomuraea sp. NN258]|uniref:hypothetical protein n=1 Tax=Nonomuraea antri TaxID=2730852 RepID=UPI001568CC80|nr:hypothetical protein [Nonomuraea antri]NRQ34816.1 hypothetical protein [Nonomuraea antri]
MIKKLCGTAAVVATAAGVALFAAPAHADVRADDWSGNWSGNSESWQSGNNLSDIVLDNEGDDGSTNLNNVNGVATTAADGGFAVTYIFY